MEDRTFELLEKMYAEFLGFKDEMMAFKDEMTDFKDEMTDFKDEMTDFKEDTTSRLSRIEVLQENMDRDIKTIAEVQTSHMEQNERQHREMMAEFEEKTNLIEGAIRHLAGETIMHTAEISSLKDKLGS